MDGSDPGDVLDPVATGLLRTVQGLIREPEQRHPIVPSSGADDDPIETVTRSVMPVLREMSVFSVRLRMRSATANAVGRSTFRRTTANSSPP